MRWPVPALLAAVALHAGACARGEAPRDARRLTVFAAASTTDVVQEAGRRFEARSGIEIVLSFDASSKLAKQIRAGAPADVYLSASRAWMDDVAAAGAVRAGTRQDLLANRLALAAPAGAAFEIEFAPGFDFTGRLPNVRRIAVGDPAYVPAGRYARQALEALGWWAELRPLLVPAMDVRAALRLVEIGEADAGIVYATDAGRSDRVVVVAVFPEALHEPIHYPIALCTDSPAGEAFVAFLRSDEMRRVFEDAGFRVLPAPEEAVTDADA